VLLVEDESIVRELSKRILDMQGYTVLEAAHPDEALRICAEYDGSIHLLITDVVMPGMGGRELAEQMLQMRPEAKVIYISGYTDDAVMRHGVLNENVNFVQKPFTPRVLAQQVRKVLDD
jgi:DNA-binding NtrC family response regulator